MTTALVPVGVRSYSTLWPPGAHLPTRRRRTQGRRPCVPPRLHARACIEHPLLRAYISLPLLLLCAYISLPPLVTCIHLPPSSCYVRAYISTGGGTVPGAGA